MDRQTLRDWVHRYNHEGLAELVGTGPNLEEHDVIRWRRVDLSTLILAKFGVHLAEWIVGSLLRRLGFARRSVRPRSPKNDPEAQEAHKKTLSTWSPLQSRSMPATSRSTFGGKTRLGSVSRAR